MENYNIDENLLADEKLYKEYLEMLILRETKMAIELDTDINDASRHEYALFVRDNMSAFKYLFARENALKNLDQEIIIEVANLVNASNQYISNGYRKNDALDQITHLPLISPTKIEQTMVNLIYNYNNSLYDDIFLNEAMLHIGIIMTQPFEDGNHRTAMLITNKNLISKHIAPVIITNEFKESYHNAVNNRDVEKLGEIFKLQSVKESKIIAELLSLLTKEQVKL